MVPRWIALVLSLAVLGLLLAVIAGSGESSPPAPTFTVTPDPPCVEYPNDTPCG